MLLPLTYGSKDATQESSSRWVKRYLVLIVMSLFSISSHAEKTDTLTKEKEAELQAVVKELKSKKDQALKHKKEQHTLYVEVTIDDALKKKLPKSASLFVYAKSISGPNKVIAYKKLDLKKSTLNFTLSDDDAVRRLYKISHSPTIFIGARISTDGTIVSSNGKLNKKKGAELEALSQPIQNTHKKIINLTLTNESA